MAWESTTHRCDACKITTHTATAKDQSDSMRQEGWARVQGFMPGTERVDVFTLDVCPVCWMKMIEVAKRR